MRSFLLLLLTLTFFSLEAGEVYLCKSFSVKGGPMNTQSEWKAKTDKICIAYKHDTYYKETAVYTIRITKKTEKNQYKRFMSKDLKVSKGSNWTVAYYRISEPGDYIITIIDDCGFILGEHTCLVKR